MPRAVRPGAVIQIYLANTIALGEVRYCIEAMEGFRLGVQVRDVFTTSLLVGKLGPNHPAIDFQFLTRCSAVRQASA